MSLDNRKVAMLNKDMRPEDVARICAHQIADSSQQLSDKELKTYSKILESLPFHFLKPDITWSQETFSQFLGQLIADGYDWILLDHLSLITGKDFINSRG